PTLSLLAFSMLHPPPTSTLFPYTTLFRSVKQEPYVEAAIALGMPRRRIILRYVLPNVAQSIPVIFSVNAADSVLTEAGLTFLGGSEEHTSELQSPDHLVCRLLLEKKKTQN